jgi:hypothetical protein
MTIGHGTTAWQPPVFRTETIAHPDEDETAALRDFSPVFGRPACSTPAQWKVAAPRRAVPR